MEPYRIPLLASKYMHHDMIEKYAELPEFPYWRTRLLHVFLNKCDPMKAEGNDLYVLVTSLLQLGLDTHDCVDNEHHAMNAYKMRAKQLLVLAGDYFSSRFYHLLSQAEQIELVRKLSAATCEVNRLKLSLYMKMRQLKLSADEYLQQIVSIKSQLFLSFSHLMDGVYKKQWPSILATFTRCEMIVHELMHMDKVQHFKGSWAYWALLDEASPEEIEQLKYDEIGQSQLLFLLDKYRLKQRLQSMLDTYIHEFFASIQSFSSGNSNCDLRHLGEKLFQRLQPTQALEDVIR